MKRTIADGAALVALCVVAAAVNIALAVFTDVDAPIRWGATVSCGVVAAATTFAIVSRVKRSRRGQ